ncbi:MAG: serine/threonine-protein kinase, partial [Planctomycetota bacterium]
MRPGTRVGPYEIVAPLGTGGAGTVFRARSADGREVAVKLLHRSDTEAFARFDRERRLLAELGEAQGFVPLLDAGASGGVPYIVMPLLAGGTLRKRLEGGALSIEETVRLGAELARALGRAHARGVVHRDVKPENVLFAHPTRPLVADLGLGKHFAHEGLGRSASLSQTGAFKGTAGYMPPEQTRDTKSVGPPADVFALGAILHECLA